MLELMDADRAS